MGDLTYLDSAGEIVPYERGLSIRSTLRATLRQFLPSSAGVLGAFALLPILSDPSRWAIVLSVVTFEVALLTVGFGLGLESLRRWLYPDAEVDGRKSRVAGLCSPLALGIVSIFTQGASALQVGTFSILAGMGMALIMYFAWLTPTEGLYDELPPEESDGSDGHIQLTGQAS